VLFKNFFPLDSGLLWLALFVDSGLFNIDLFGDIGLLRGDFRGESVGLNTGIPGDVIVSPGRLKAGCIPGTWLKIEVMNDLESLFQFSRRASAI
jgi:hypothetical protein